MTEAKGGFGGYGANYGASRFDTMQSFDSNYTHARLAARAGAQGARRIRPGSRTTSTSSWTLPMRRLRQLPRRAGPAARAPTRRTPLTIEGELVAKSTGTVSTFALGDRVFHQKFGNGNVTHVDGNKLTIQFDKAGEKRVVDSFVERI